MTQVVARVGDELLARVDRLISQGVLESRSEAVRLGLTRLIEASERAEIGRKIVDGYLRIPPNDELEEWAEVAGRAMVEAEPW